MLKLEKYKFNIKGSAMYQFYLSGTNIENVTLQSIHQFTMAQGFRNLTHLAFELRCCYGIQIFHKAFQVGHFLIQFFGTVRRL